MLFGVSQELIRCPILFLLYILLTSSGELRHMGPHLFADDSQMYGFCCPCKSALLQSRVFACVGDVDLWMRSNRLQLNVAQTEVLWCASARRQNEIPVNSMMVSMDTVQPVRSVRDLGIHLDSDLSMRTHVTRTVSSCFAVLRQIRGIRRSVRCSVVQSLIVSLVRSRLGYGGATLAGLPARLLEKLQSVQNAVARLIFESRKYDHVTPLLHWLIDWLIEFRLFRQLT